MRVAVLIIGLFLTFIIGLQSCAAGLGGAMSNDSHTSAAAGTGGLILFMYLIGSAFVMGLPRVSAGVFALAGMIGLLADTGQFKDLKVWGGAALILAVMAFFGASRASKLHGS